MIFWGAELTPEQLEVLHTALASGFFGSGETAAAFKEYTKKVRKRCGSCGKFMSKETAYVVVNGAHIHMVEKCLAKAFGELPKSFSFNKKDKIEDSSDFAI